MTSSVVVQAGIPALGTMLVIAAIALVLGLIALRLSRRHTRREAADLEAAGHEAAEQEAAGRAADEGSATNPAAPPTDRRPGPPV